MHSLPAASVATAAARAATLRPAAAKLLICMNYRRVEWTDLSIPPVNILFGVGCFSSLYQ